MRTAISKFRKAYSEIRLMAVNIQNESIIHRPNTPEFYPGIPYREYWQDINFEDFVYRCGSKNMPLYSYVNAHGFWLKGFYLPITEPGTKSAIVTAQQTTDMISSCVRRLRS